jgi:hypothetical protein
VVISMGLDCNVEIEGMAYRGMVAVMAGLSKSWGDSMETRFDAP